MANTIRWLPNTEADIASYRVERSTSSDSGFTALTTITHDLGDVAVYVAPYFFYVDATGTNAHYYRIVAIDSSANESSASAAFQPAAAPPTPFTNSVAFNQDYGGTRNLTPVDSNGDNIDNCQIRVYTKADYDNNVLGTPWGITESNASGNWDATIYVAPGTTYTIHFEKENVFSPVTVEVTV